jgi:hypothetical protein
MNSESYYIIVCIVGLTFLALFALLVYYESIRKKAGNKILAMLTTEWIRGRDLRQMLAKDGLHISDDLFCFTMNKLVEEEKAERRNANNLIWYRLPMTIEERKKEAAAYVARLGR